MADNLQELFARLKAQSDPHSSPPPPNAPQQAPSIWANANEQSPHSSGPSSIFSPPASSPAGIIHSARSASAAGNAAATDQQRTNNLLNLLKFNNGQAGTQQAQGGPMASLQNVSIGRSTSASGSRPVDTHALSAQNLVATLQRQPSTPGANAPIVTGVEGPRTHVSTSSGNQQDFLLNLLKKPIAAPQPVAETPIKVEPQDDVKILAENLAETSINQESADPVAALRQSTPIRHFGSPEVGGSGFDASSSMTKTAKFTHVNPFEQLHASSPLNHSPKPEVPGKVEILKHDREVSNATNGDSQQPAHKTRKLTADEAPTERKSVAETLENVGDAVAKQATQALAEASSNVAATVASKPVKKEVNGDNDEVESSWESAEDSATEKTHIVQVYNFPMKPFVTIKVKPLDDVFPVRQDHFMQIANLKKDFDQTDRCLVTASQSHIVYAQPASKKENKGLKIIQQDSGEHKSVFNQHGERVFNVQMCTPAEVSNDVETVLGTGVDGSVFWTSLARSNPNLFAEDDVEGQGFIMPPVATLEENTSGSPIKTRAKLSARHPDFFAIGRGKQIHIVGPDVVKDYCIGSSRKVDSEKYFRNHSLKLSTGKAGKDFCFSEDDSTIVSLDKSGRVKFWDIRNLSRRAVEHNESGAGIRPEDMREPMWQLIATASGSKADEKPSVSSVMLLDKDRPHNKGLALRYMLIGFKQNHILQLWDLGLGKAVQEVCLPHEKDSDGICSITYHPKTGIIAVGHPTRNSIYFIHLSAPKYNLGNIDHATFISMIAKYDPALPKPESTAIMSGIREVSFARAGQIRSIDMLRTPSDLVNEKGSEDETMFELYIMHGRGVTGMSVKKADLGWDVNSKLVKSVDAKETGAAEVTELRISPRVFTPSEAETPTKKAAEKKDEKKHETPKKTEVKKEAAPALKPAAQEMPKQAGNGQSAGPKNPVIVLDAAYLAKEAAKENKEAAEHPEQTTLHQVTRDVGLSSTDDIGKRFDNLYQRLESDRRVAEAASVAKQEAILRLISSTLTENVEQSLHSIVGSSIEKNVLPALSTNTGKVFDRHLAEQLPQQLDGALQRMVKSALPGALQVGLHNAFKDPQLMKMISDITANQISSKVQQQMTGLLQQSMSDTETQAAHRMAAEMEKQLQTAEKRRQQDTAKIEELSGLVRDLSGMVQNLMEQQTALSEQVRAGSAVTNSQGPDSTVGALNTIETDPEEEEIEEITSKLVAREFEAATLQWLQSPRQSQLFDRLFIRVNPQYLNQVNPLVALSVSAAITATFETNVDARLDWLMSVLSQINVQDPDVIDVAPGIMDVLSQRLQGAYMNISEANPSNAVLRKISEVNRRVNEVRRMTA